MFAAVRGCAGCDTRLSLVAAAGRDHGRASASCAPNHDQPFVAVYAGSRLLWTSVDRGCWLFGALRKAAQAPADQGRASCRTGRPPGCVVAERLRLGCKRLLLWRVVLIPNPQLQELWLALFCAFRWAAYALMKSSAGTSLTPLGV